MTLVLVLLCLAIAGRELYSAFDRRLPRAQAELRVLREKVAGLERRLGELPAPAEEPAPALEAAPAPSRALTADPPPGWGGPEPEAVRTRLRRLERELSDMAGSLNGLRDELERDREAQRARARDLDAIERVVAELRRELVERLEREGAVRGLLRADETAVAPMLTTAYEHCAIEHGLRIAARDEAPRTAAEGRPRKGGFWSAGFLLAGRQPDELAAGLLTEARALRDPVDNSALSALLTELAQLRGGGVVRIGAFTAVRTSQGLVCGLLPEQGEPSDPTELTGRISELPAALRADLTWLCPPT